MVIVALVSMQNKLPEDKFSVSAIGKVYAKANVANLTVGFRTETKKTAALAVEENSRKMNEIIKELKALDIQAKDIKTTNYNLQPIYDWTRDRGQQLKGYQVSQNLSIKVRDLDKIGQAVAKTTEKGANQIGGINFTIDDEDELKAQARDEAIAKAKEKAREIVKISGIKLGKIINVYENRAYAPTRVNYAKSMDLGMGGGEEITAPQIEVGENEVKVEVTVVYKVR